MKVILLQAVPKVGQKYDVKNVAPGYGRNFLLRQKLAILATPETAKQIEGWRKKQSTEMALQEDLLFKSLAGLAGTPVTLKAKANEEGHLFAGLHPAEIAAAISAQTKIAIPPEQLVLAKAIKEAGTFPVVVKVGDKEITLSIVVEKA